jgi:hypothetical protein
VTIAHGLVIAVAAMAATFVVVALAGLALVAIQIQEERHRTGCRAAGGRRSRRGHGCDRPRVAEPARGTFTQGE